MADAQTTTKKPYIYDQGTYRLTIEDANQILLVKDVSNLFPNAPLRGGTHKRTFVQFKDGKSFLVAASMAGTTASMASGFGNTVFAFIPTEEELGRISPNETSENPFTLKNLGLSGPIQN